MSEKVFTIREFGSEILRQKASAVDSSEITTQEFQDTVSKMKETLASAGGVGLAAPQVGISKRFFLADISGREPGSEDKISLSFLINPEITSFSEDVEADWEGCLSFSGLWGQVPRSTKISVRYIDELGKEIEKELSGFAARVFQHELDHLDGILFVDRMPNMLTLMTDKEFNKRNN